MTTFASGKWGNGVLEHYLPKKISLKHNVTSLSKQFFVLDLQAFFTKTKDIQNRKKESSSVSQELLQSRANICLPKSQFAREGLFRGRIIHYNI